MSDSISIKSSIHDYQVDFIDRLQPVLSQLRDDDVVIIDAKVKELYKDDLNELLARVNHIEIAANETAKSYQGVEPVIQRLIEVGFRKNHRLVAFGGGIVQDITAFIASILYRGVEWVFFPTTLLAQGDSCIGSKNSINFGCFKNQVGGFYPPSQIYICPAFLQTLSSGDLLSGLGEMYHYFLIAGKEQFDWYVERFEPALIREPATLIEVVSRSLMIKKPMVERDEFDRKERQIFNYGHSFGHAVESLTNYRVPHGIAVAYGMDMANFVSEKLGLLKPGIRSEVRVFLEKVWSDYPITDLSSEPMMDALGKDKKNAGNQLGLILTRGYGDMFKKQVEKAPISELMADYFRSELK